MDESGSLSCVKLETDFEQSIDEINTQKLRLNGLRKRRGGLPDYRDSSDSDASAKNGFLEKRRRRPRPAPAPRPPRGGKPFSHEMRQTPKKAPVRLPPPSGGKPRSMMELSKKKTNRKSTGDTYLSQISHDSNRIKIKIRKASSKVEKRKRRKSRPAPPSPLSCSEPEDNGEEEEEEEDERETEEESVIRRQHHHRHSRHRRQQHQEEDNDEEEEEEDDEEESSSEGEETKVVTPRALPAVVVTMTPTVIVAPIPKPKARPERQRKSRAKSSKSASETSATPESKARPPVVQGPWGADMPEEVLVAIFRHVVSEEGTLPSLIRLGEVCKSWHAASITPALWNIVELSHHTRDKCKVDHRLIWLLENRLSMCQHLNLSNWNVSNLAWIVSSLVECCQMLEELNLTGWNRMSVDQLKELTHGLPKLARLDLSCMSETSSSGGCLSVLSLTQMSQGMAERLTHLTLANNKLAGLSIILNSIATNCPNLELLDLSNLFTVSHPAMVPLEGLQKGCPRLRVLRITNSQVFLATASTQDKMESPGFPLLEELSVACPSTNYKLVDDEALGRILKASTCLRLLDVRGCIRITDSGLIKVPAWDLQHLFLSGCLVTRQSSSCLELICEKWSHSLLEVDLAWSTAKQPLDAAVDALAEKGKDSKLRILNLCGSSVSFESVKRILIKCPNLDSVNLASCRALPRGMKRLYTGQELIDLRDSYDPVKVKEKEEQERLAKEKKKKEQEEAKQKQEEAKKSKEEAKAKEEGKDTSVKEEEIKSPDNNSIVSETEREDSKVDIKSPNSATSSPTVVQASPSVNKLSDSDITVSVRSAEQDYSPQQVTTQTFSPAPKSTPSVNEPFSPQPSTSGISTPRSNVQDFSPASNQITPEVVSASNICDSDSRQDATRASSGWNVDQYSPLNKQETLSSSQPSPDTAFPNPLRQETAKTGSNWNIGHYSPSVSRQESPYPSQISPSVQRQESPYSSQNSPSVMRQESPYSSQKSPSMVRLESPYSSQKSPSVASPYSTQIRSPSVVRQESPYSSVKSPSVVRQESPYSSHVSPSVGRQESPYSSHVSPSVGRQESPYSSHVSPSVGRQESPYSSHVSPSMGRQESPYSSVKSPYPSVKSPYTSQKSPDVGPGQTQAGGGSVKQGWSVDQYSPVMRQETASSSQPSPEAPPTRNWNLERFSPMPSSAMMPSPDTSQVTSTGKPTSCSQWNLDRFSPMARGADSAPSPETSSTAAKPWNLGHFSPLTRRDASPDAAPRPAWTQQQHHHPQDAVVVPTKPSWMPQAPPKHRPQQQAASSWNLDQFGPMQGRVDSSSGPLPSMWSAGGMAPSVPPSVRGDSVTTTTYCTTAVDQNIFRGYRDPLNGPSTGVD